MRGKIFFLILFNLHSILNARLRQDVINDANEYANLPWTVNINNVLDLHSYKFIDGEWKTLNSTDTIDDRAQVYYDSKTGKTYYNTFGNRS